MKANYIEEQGDIEVLTYGDLPEPTPGPDDLLIRVRATALNHLDTFARAGRNGVKIDRFPHVLGCDLAGEVAEVGSNVDGFSTGDRVLADYTIRCGVCSACHSGRDEFCIDSKSIGVNVDGGYAEYVAIPAVNAHVIPSSLSFDEAAAIPLVYKTVWHCLMTRCDMKPGEDVLIMAAGSGVGSAAIRFCKTMGARVITTASTEEKLAKAREIGADETINYVDEPKFSKRVRKLTNGKGADLIFDSVGTDVWDENIKSLRPGGRLVNCGVTSGHRASIRIGHMFSQGHSYFGASTGNKSDFANVMRLVRQGKIRGVISQTFPLAAAADAHRAMQDRNVFGKLVLQVP